MGEKEAEPIEAESGRAGAPQDYSDFNTTFSRLDTHSTLATLRAMLRSEAERSRVGRYLIKGVCDQYQGNYNPHYLTGLGSALWVMDRFADQHRIVDNALYQYLDYFFTDLKS